MTLCSHRGMMGNHLPPSAAGCWEKPVSSSLPPGVLRQLDMDICKSTYNIWNIWKVWRALPQVRTRQFNFNVKRDVCQHSSASSSTLDRFRYLSTSDRWKLTVVALQWCQWCDRFPSRSFVIQPQTAAVNWPATVDLPPNQRFLTLHPIRGS